MKFSENFRKISDFQNFRFSEIFKKINEHFENFEFFENLKFFEKNQNFDFFGQNDTFDFHFSKCPRFFLVNRSWNSKKKSITIRQENVIF